MHETRCGASCSAFILHDCLAHAVSGEQTTPEAKRLLAKLVDGAINGGRWMGLQPDVIEWYSRYFEPALLRTNIFWCCLTTVPLKQQVEIDAKL